MKKLAVAAIIAALSSTPAFAAPGNTSTATGTATATVVAPIVLTHTPNAALAFGTFTAGGGGTVVVTRAGNGSVTGDVNFVAGSVNSADQFTVAGDPSRAFIVTAAGGSVSDGTNSMTFTTNVQRNHTLDSSGAASFSVGGTLTVPSGAPANSYTGDYNVTATYN